jgi:lipopolysaccharide/colanic/teichoic acid biosynthesis glycosyltransferase
MTGIVLPGAGREGLKLLTEWVPECLIPLAGKPLLEHQIELFVRNGITRIVVVVIDRLYEVEEYFGRGERWGVTLKFILAGAEQPLSTWLELAQSQIDDDVRVVITATTLTVEDLVGRASTGLSVALLPRAAGDHALENLEGYLAETLAVISDEREGVIIPAPEREPGIRVGRNTRISATARLIPPVVIGSNCQIREGVELTGAVIGDRVVIDRQARVDRSVILENSYVGSHTEVVRSIVRKNGLINVERGIAVTVTDPIILADLAEVIPEDRKERFIDLATASVFCVLCSPVLLLMFLLDLLIPPLRLISRDRRYGNREVPTLSGAYIKKPFNLLQFRFGPRIVRKLPGLVNVLRGDLAIVGAQPLSDEDLAEITGKWQELRQDNTRGLFHIWESEGDADTSFEEKLVMENFYAATRSWKEDLKILSKIVIS